MLSGSFPFPPLALRVPPFPSLSPQITIIPLHPRLSHVHSPFVPRSVSSLHQPVLKAPKCPCWLPSPSHQGPRALHLQFETSFHSILANDQHTGTEILETFVVHLNSPWSSLSTAQEKVLPSYRCLVKYSKIGCCRGLLQTVLHGLSSFSSSEQFLDMQNEFSILGPSLFLLGLIHGFHG